MRYVRWIALMLAFPAVSCFGQLNSIEGYLFDQKTNAPIEFAHVYNWSEHLGTITNVDGYFTLQIGSITDSITISYIGYKNHALDLSKGLDDITVYLEEATQLLPKIVVLPNNDEYLLNILAACKASAVFRNVDAKAYFDLKSWRDNQQIELLENYYNILLSGPHIKDLSLKAGRLAVKPVNNLVFGSLGSSEAINKLRLWGFNHYFPNTPIELSRAKAEQQFDLRLSKQYLNAQNDSIYVIDYYPEQPGGRSFSGQIWVNKPRNHILKITMNCTSCAIHPFAPIFPTDEIVSVDFNITKTFKSLDQGYIFNHIDFFYNVDYVSRTEHDGIQPFSVQTKAILYAYDFGKSFWLPDLYQEEIKGGDYQKINGIPYNDFFWGYHTEYGLNDQKHQNDQYYYHPKTINNQEVHQEQAIGNTTGLFDFPFITWSDSVRVEFEQKVTDTIPPIMEDRIKRAKKFKINYKEKTIRIDGKLFDLSQLELQKLSGLSNEFNLPYHLDIQFFVDINQYQGQLDVQTAVIFDPYNSFYYLPLDNRAQCFMHLYFDWHEVKRRELERILSKAKNRNQLLSNYEQFKTRYAREKKSFLQEMEQGNNQTAMLKW
ncbi:MAG: carboxypeptidase-like regulatory domain-containing protein, partial [Bacteroidota bacterium]